jgi:hypothetical protein
VSERDKHQPAGQHRDFFDWWDDWGHPWMPEYVKELCLEAWEDGKEGAYRVMDEEKELADAD